MKRNLLRFFFSGVVLLCFFAYGNVFAAATPAILSYQGRLADSASNLLGGAGTTYYFKFSIWNNPTVGSGSKLWPASSPSSVPLTVRQGVFNANIGDTAAGYPDVLDYNFAGATDIYLQVEVSSDNVTFQTLAPRQRVGASPFAQVAGSVSGSSNGSYFGTTSPVGNSVVSIESTSTQGSALSIRSVLGQLARIFQIQNSAGTNVFSIDAAGGVFASSTLRTSGAVDF